MKIVDDIIDGTHFGEVIPLYAVDVESTMRSPGEFSADPFYYDNKALLVGYKKLTETDTRTRIPEDIHVFLYPTPIAVVGTNVKFDLHYLRKHGDPDYFKNIVMAYDLQVMYHLITGTPFAKLDEIAEFCGLADGKLDSLSEHIKNGGTTETMRREDLAEYLTRDVDVTAECFTHLWFKLSDKQRVLVNIAARTTMALAEMEWNGIKVDKSKLYKTSMKLQNERDTLESFMRVYIREYFRRAMVPPEIQEAVLSKLTTNRSINQAILGFPIKIKRRRQEGNYKNGNPKFVTYEELYEIPPVISHGELQEILGIPNKTLGFSVNDKNLTKLLSEIDPKTPAGEYIQTIQEWRKCNKLLSTYIEPIGKYLSEYKTDTIHGTFNQAATATGRLSSSRPNLQNMPKEIDELFVNRFDSSYGRFTPDFKQLEVCGTAHVSGDKQLLADLLAGTDIHDTVSKQVGLGPEMRRTVKGIVFGTIYGGGVKKLASESGVDTKVVKQVCDAFFDRYPTLKAFYKDFHNRLKRRGFSYSTEFNSNGEQVATMRFMSETGRSFFYKEYKSKFSGKMEPSWTHACNYRSQGWSTGDIVPTYIALAHTFQRYYDKQKYLKEFLFTNTVHDSLYGDGNFTENSI